jgi:hypothetical protein
MTVIKHLIDATKDLPYYEVQHADYVDDAFPPKPLRVFAMCVPGQAWAMDEEDAACEWAEQNFAHEDYPDVMETLVTHSDGRKWRVTVTVETVPVFRGRSKEVTT